MRGLGGFGSGFDDLDPREQQRRIGSFERREKNMLEKPRTQKPPCRSIRRHAVAEPSHTHTMPVRTSFAKRFKLTRSRVTPKVGVQASATPKAGQATRRRSWVLSLPTVRSWCFDPHSSYPSTQLF